MNEQQTNKILVSNIQRFCLKDGPGIRTTVFLMGCSLNCPWCANPENLNSLPIKYFKDGEEFVFGKYYNPQELLDEILKDEWIYSRGGVTFSGGEPLLLIGKLLPVLKELQRLNIHICFETALNVDFNCVVTACSFVNLFLVDIKTLDNITFHKVFNGKLEKYLKNFEYLSKNSNVNVRMPLAKDLNSNEYNLNLVIKLLKENGICSLEVFEIHNLANRKYKLLGKRVYNPKKFTEIELKSIVEYFKCAGITARLITI